MANKFVRRLFIVKVNNSLIMSLLIPSCIFKNTRSYNKKFISEY